MNRWPLVLFVVLAAMIGVMGYRSIGHFHAAEQIMVAGHSFTVELARTPAEWEKGLMNRTSLQEDHGMLFIFPDSQIRTFWMKNTVIPLDIIFINDSQVVDLVTIEPATGESIPTYTSKASGNYVLEIPAGSSQSSGIGIGSIVKK